MPQKKQALLMPLVSRRTPSVLIRSSGITRISSPGSGLSAKNIHLKIEIVAEEFDVYCTTSAPPFRERAVVALDGIDGFFDQYFEAARPGQIIRFAVLPGGPSAMPASIEGLQALPFVVARVERCDVTGGDVEVLSIATLGEWSRSVNLVSQPLEKLQAELPDAPLADLVARAAQDGSAYWRSGVAYWRSLNETTAVAALRDASGVRVTVICTNAVPGLVAQVRPAAWEPG
jgi:hypothetical protein